MTNPFLGDQIDVLGRVLITLPGEPATDMSHTSNTTSSPFTNVPFTSTAPLGTDQHRSPVNRQRLWQVFKESVDPVLKIPSLVSLVSLVSLMSLYQGDVVIIGLSTWEERGSLGFAFAFAFAFGLTLVLVLAFVAVLAFGAACLGGMTGVVVR